MQWLMQQLQKTPLSLSLLFASGPCAFGNGIPQPSSTPHHPMHSFYGPLPRCRDEEEGDKTHKRPGMRQEKRKAPGKGAMWKKQPRRSSPVPPKRCSKRARLCMREQKSDVYSGDACTKPSPSQPHRPRYKPPFSQGTCCPGPLLSHTLLGAPCALRLRAAPVLIQRPPSKNPVFFARARAWLLLSRSSHPPIPTPSNKQLMV